MDHIVVLQWHRCPSLVRNRALSSWARIGAYRVDYERHTRVRLFEFIQQGNIFLIHNDGVYFGIVEDVGNVVWFQPERLVRSHNLLKEQSGKPTGS